MSKQPDYQELRIKNLIALLKKVKAEHGNLPIYICRRAGHSEKLHDDDVSVREQILAPWWDYYEYPKRVLIGD